ncbi:hypothetical protein FOMPIDRAFT_83116 [Fomitopsis schrenkii]|uniref:Uncharacterized protein n=1 Tax=Fomitopsis schrenkii TaxID=2126942 RepID=S8FWE7_FOMSC|nr:hypothetical protein FOMPIDRAFT_83116 [Fomitopsis schrenkii]
MVNIRGKNGCHNGEAPPESILHAALHEYAFEKLTIKERIDRLADEYGYYIKSTKLKALNKKFGIPSTRKPPPLPVAISHVAENMDKYNGMTGPDTITRMLAADGVLIPRDTVREIMHSLDPDGADRRAPYPVRKNKLGHVLA